MSNNHDHNKPRNPAPSSVILLVCYNWQAGLRFGFDHMSLTCTQPPVTQGHFDELAKLIEARRSEPSEERPVPLPEGATVSLVSLTPLGRIEAPPQTRLVVPKLHLRQ